ncbi:hypothetical protein, partial [Desulfovibrio desulfuricans]|uniref:hypothetical protein n=1 Tax=Desulfovibrio desulfuricans TaxID=876 RepID=UPI0035B0D2F7
MTMFSDRLHGLRQRLYGSKPPWPWIWQKIRRILVFVLTWRRCLLRVHFSRHGDVTLRLAVEPKSKKVIDLWSEGEHNRSSRLKKNDWLHGETKSFARRKKVVDFESRGEHKRSSRL